MWTVIVTRVVKKNTGAQDRYAPRSANVEAKYASGPFLSLKAAQAAMVAALATHTCLGARVLSEAQVRDQHAKGWSINGEDTHRVLSAAVESFDAARLSEK